MNDIGIRKLRLFLSVIEEGSFTKASLKNNISQPAVTIAINQIEESLGINVFERTGNTRQTTLTEKGNEVAAIFSQMVQNYDDMMGEIDNSAGRTRSKKIAVQNQYTSAFPDEWIETLIGLFGDSRISVSADDRESILKNVGSREADFGLVDGYVDSELVDYFHISTEPIGLLIHANHEIAETGVDALDWSRFPRGVMMLTQINAAVTNRIRATFRRCNITTNGVIEVDSVTLMKVMLRDKSRIALLPRCCARDLMEDHQFKFVNLENPIIELPVGFAAPRGSFNRANFSEFLQYTQNLFLEPINSERSFMSSSAALS